MGHWGSEEQLLRFSQKHHRFMGREGIRRPTGQGIWVDVIDGAKKS